jgi:hypothetical protein
MPNCSAGRGVALREVKLKTGRCDYFLLVDRRPVGMVEAKIRDHIATSLTIEPYDFDFAPFSQRGGLGKVYQLFGEKLPALLEEINEVLAA